MINNNHMVKVTTIKYYIADSIVCKPNEYSDECTMSLEYLFNFHYEAGFTAYVPFRANLLRGQYGK